MTITWLMLFTCNWIHIVFIQNKFYTENTFYSRSDKTEMLYTEMSMGMVELGIFEESELMLIACNWVPLSHPQARACPRA